MRHLVLIALSDHDSGIEQVVDSAEVELRHADSLELSIEWAQREKPSVVLVRYAVSDARVIPLLANLRSVCRSTPVILLGSGAAGDAPLLDNATRVFDRWSMPMAGPDLARQLQVALQTAQDSKSSVACSSDTSFFIGEERWAGVSDTTHRLVRTIQRMGDADECAVIAGETGTGKTLAARAIHHQRRRSASFFVSVNCALAPAVLEEDLFGSSIQARLARLEQARGGTLFLRHVECMPAAVQARLVHWLQARAAESFQNPPWPDTRIVASVAGSPESAVDNGLLRQDLFNLLNASRLDLPPLRERLEDVPSLATYFLGRLAAGFDGRPKALSLVVSRIFSRYRWPGNVRELEQVLRSTHASAHSDLIQLGDLPAPFLNAVGPSLLEPAAVKNGRGESTEAVPGDLNGLSSKLFQWARRDTHFQVIPAVERELIMHAMVETKGNQVQASKLLGITRATLRKRLLRFKIRREVLIH